MRHKCYGTIPVCCGKNDNMVLLTASRKQSKVRRNKSTNHTFTGWLGMSSYGESTLLWHHNGSDGVSNHQPHDCLLKGSFRRRSKKTSKPRVTGLCVGNSPGPMYSTHKWPVTRKMFPFDDVIMTTYFGHPQPGFKSITQVWNQPHQTVCKHVSAINPAVETIT